MLESIVIVGAGRTGDALAQRLSHVAPLVVLDTSPEALAELKPMPVAEGAPRGSNGPAGRIRRRHEVRSQLADGTSRLVLEDLRGKARDSVALVAATGDDRHNLEVCRLARELGFRPLVAITIDPGVEEQYRALGVKTVVRPSLLGDVVERAILHDGVAVASHMGLGKGDIIETVVLASSPVIGTPLMQLDPQGWRVAAIYRGDELVIPMGNTTIQADDRVLLIGDPALLPHVAENLRKGLPDFPLRYGPNIAVYLPGGRDRSIEGVAEVLTLKTRAHALIRLSPGAAESRTEIEEDAGDTAVALDHRHKAFCDAPLVGETLEDQVHSLLDQKPGLVVARSRKRGTLQRIFGLGGHDAALCNLLSVPVLFPNGDPHYDRIVYVLGTEQNELRTADAGIDLARLLNLPLMVLRVDLPAFFGAPGALLDQIVEAVERRSRLHGLAATVTRLQGNPIAQVVQLATPRDLLVVSRDHRRADSFTNPDVGLRIAHEAPCSTLVVTH